MQWGNVPFQKPSLPHQTKARWAGEGGSSAGVDNTFEASQRIGYTHNGYVTTPTITPTHHTYT